MTTQGKALALLNFARLRACDPGDVGDLARAWLAVREDGDSLRAEVERLNSKVARALLACRSEVTEMRDQVEQLTAELDSVQSAALTMVDRLTAERDAAQDHARDAKSAVAMMREGLEGWRTRAETAERERDEARKALCRKTFELGAQVRRLGPSSVLIAPEPGQRPVECLSSREVADAWGWGYLFPDTLAALTGADAEREAIDHDEIARGCAAFSEGGADDGE